MRRAELVAGIVLLVVCWALYAGVRWAVAWCAAIFVAGAS